MLDTLVIATANRHKASELAEFLDGPAWRLRTLRDFPPLPEPVEDGSSFGENAVKKASAYAAALGLPCVADDSGLEVDALNGAPGILSARYAGTPPSYEKNNRKLLEALAECAEPNRTARFVCCAALALPRGDVHVETGTVEGRIAFACRGTHGFGYDPLFIPQGYDLTFGELDPAVKRAISHRSRAFGKLREYLSSLP